MAAQVGEGGLWRSCSTTPADSTSQESARCRAAVMDSRGRLLMAALGFAGCSMPSYDRALWALRSWLDSWSGIGHVAVGMHRFGLQLDQSYDASASNTLFLQPKIAIIRSPVDSMLAGRNWRGCEPGGFSWPL